MSIYTVYKVTNLINCKEYIGVHATENPYDDYLGSGVRIKLALKKYGKENFKKEILFIFNNPEDMIAKEAELVNEEYVKREDTYNLVSGGIYRKYFSEDTLAKKSNVMKEYYKNNPHKCLEMSIRNRTLTRELWKNADYRNHVIENLPNISGENNPMYGKIFSEKHRKLLSENSYNKGKTLSDEYKLKISKGRKNVIMVDVVCPFCLKTGKLNLMKRWHFNNCKFKDVLNNNMNFHNSNIEESDLSLNTLQT